MKVSTTAGARTPASRSNTVNRSALSLAVACTLLWSSAGVAQEVGVIGDPESWRTEEFDADWGLAAIGAEYAYARGLSGAGIRMGLFDSGVALNHQEFAGKDHRGLIVGVLADDGSRCAPGPYLSGPDACFGTDGSKPQIYASNWDTDLEASDLPPAYRYLIGQLTIEYDSHGTHVAGTMAANRDGNGMHGVAFGALFDSARAAAYTGDQLMQMTKECWYDGICQVDSTSAQADGSVIEHAHSQMAANGVRVINNSWGYHGGPPLTEEGAIAQLDALLGNAYNGPRLQALARGSRDYGVLQVWSAGNFQAVASPDQASEPTAPANLPFRIPEIAPYWVSVVNLNRDLTLSASSAKCGISMNWCISAPGTGIASTVVGPDISPNDDPRVSRGTAYTDANGNLVLDTSQATQSYGYEDYTGTSMAAPHVTGALALLMERFPYLDNPQVRDVMFTTATDLGAVGVDDTYGWGLLNLRKAIDGPGMLLVDTDVAMNQRAGGAKVWEGEAWDDWRNDISGPGRMTKSGIGWLRLSGDNSFAGLAVNQGTLELTGANAFSGDVTVNAANFLLGGSMTGSNLTLGNGATTTISGSMAGGDIAADASTVTLSGTLDNGSLTSANGTVQVSGAINGGSITSSNGPVTLSGTLTGGNLTSENGAVTVSGVLNGNLVSDGGPVVLSGQVSGGDVTVRNGNLDLSGALEDGSLAFDTGNANIGGTITGGGVDFRNGTLNLSGSVTGGGLNLVNSTATVNGSVSGASMVGVGSTLRGTGSTGDLTVLGTISPGNSIGTFNVTGNYVQGAGSFYDVELTPPSSSDRLNVTGTATLQGGTVRAYESDGVYILGQSYRILSADGGVTGQFAALDYSSFASPFIQFELAYGANSVDLNVLRGESLATVAVTPNEIATATALDSLPNSSELLQAVVMLGIDEIQPVFNQLSGEAHASTQAMLVDGSRHARNAALARASNGHDGFTSQHDDGKRFGAWVDVQGNGGELEGDGNAARVDYDGSTTLAGIDYQFDGGWRIGLLGGIGKTDASLDGRGSTVAVDSRFAGLYAGQRWGGFGLRGGLTYAWNEVEVERDIAFRGFQDQTRGEYDGTTRQAFIEGGYRFATGVFEIEPYLQYAQVRSEADAFTEQGGPAAVTGQANDVEVGLATAGVRFNANLKGSQQEQTWLSLRGGVGYRQADGDEFGTAHLAFVDGSDVFQIQGAPLADKATIAELGLAARLSQNSLLELGYSGQFADEGDDHGVNARFSVRF